MDFDKLSKRQQEVLGLIAINLDEGHPLVTLKSLARMGYIAQAERPGFWYVPLPVHAAWCEWCSKQEESDERVEP